MLSLPEGRIIQEEPHHPFPAVFKQQTTIGIYALIFSPTHSEYFLYMVDRSPPMVPASSELQVKEWRITFHFSMSAMKTVHKIPPPSSLLDQDHR